MRNIWDLLRARYKRLMDSKELGRFLVYFLGTGVHFVLTQYHTNSSFLINSNYIKLEYLL